MQQCVCPGSVQRIVEHTHAAPLTRHPLDPCPGEITIFPMDPLLLVALKVVGAVAGIGLFYYFLYRAVLSARKKGRAGIGGQLMATALTFFSGTALDPARGGCNRTAEAQAQSRREQRSGLGLSTVAVRVLRWCPGAKIRVAP